MLTQIGDGDVIYNTLEQEKEGLWQIFHTKRLHAEGGRVDVHVTVLHHLPHLLVQLAIAAHALHHLARPIPLADEFAHVLFSDT